MFSVEFCNKWYIYFVKIIAPSILATLEMLSVCMLLAYILGFGIAVVLITYGPCGLKPNNKIYGILDFIVNIIRSFPIMILIVAISPITRMVVGTTIGVRAVIFPLTIAAAPFIARLIENSFLEVDRQLIEAARSFGASNLQIIWKVMLVEATPSIISGIVLTIIYFLAATTLAGAVGGGGLGAVALTYGYQSFNDTVLYTCVLILFFMVQIIQGVGNWIYKKAL